MRKLIVSEFVTLDGVMQAPGGKDEDRDGGFEHGGWTVPYWHDDIGKSFDALMKDADALLLGESTSNVLGSASGRQGCMPENAPADQAYWEITLWHVHGHSGGPRHRSDMASRTSGRRSCGPDSAARACRSPA